MGTSLIIEMRLLKDPTEGFVSFLAVDLKIGLTLSKKNSYALVSVKKSSVFIVGMP